MDYKKKSCNFIAYFKDAYKIKETIVQMRAQADDAILTLKSTDLGILRIAKVLKLSNSINVRRGKLA